MRWLSLLCLASGCHSLGEGDVDLALEVVYSPAGDPAFAGQALVNQGCGGAAFCHSGGVERCRTDEDCGDPLTCRDNVCRIPPENTFGAPLGLSFDLTAASTSGDVEQERSRRLVHDQLAIFDLRALVWEQVASGRMPPGREAGGEYSENIRDLGIEWERVGDDGLTFSPLPTIDTPEGREIFRNWLAAGAPVVERYEARRDRQPNFTGYTVPICERNCVDVNWPAIYRGIVRRGCIGSRCHDDDDPEADLDLDCGTEDETTGCSIENGDGDAVYGELVLRFARGSRCNPTLVQAHFGQGYLVEPGEPNDSILFQKVEREGREVCGSRMPLGGNPLSEQRLCALREWIACGACRTADDPACMACEAAARATCNIVLPGDSSGDGLCTPDETECDPDVVACEVQLDCPNRPP